MGEEAKDMVAEIKSINQEINALATEAQQSNDSVLIQCIGEAKLQSRYSKIYPKGHCQECYGTTTEKAQYEFRKISVVLPRVKQFYNEAQSVSVESVAVMKMERLRHKFKWK